MAAPVGVVQLFPWDGGCALAGTASSIAVHAHHAIQITLGHTKPVRLRASDDEPWVGYMAGLIAPRQPHALDGTNVGYGAVVLVEPESLAGQALLALSGDAGIVSVDSPAVAAATQVFFNAWLEGRERSAVIAALWMVIHVLTDGIEPAVVTDGRIMRAVAYINANLDRSLTLDDVASEACLSPSRFRHLFVEQAGMGLRPYVLWRRFLRVWELIMSGQSISTAAHAAGFADSAHLTRTSWQMFGVPPSLFHVADEVPALQGEAAG